MTRTSRAIIVTLLIPLAVAAMVPATAHAKSKRPRATPTLASPLPAARKLAIRHDAWGSGRFGATRGRGRATYRHQGLDLLSPAGTPVYAVKAGRARVGRTRGMGKYVEVIHSPREKTKYGHLSKILVNSRQAVRQGQLIGRVGKTGNAQASGIQPHLHFEWWKRGRAVDPTPALRRYLAAP